jgi:uncharacterized protein (DUF1330 family)
MRIQFACTHEAQVGPMNANRKVRLALIAGVFTSGAAINGLHAQCNAPVYVILEIDVSDQDAFLKQYAVKSRALGRKFGGRILVAGSGKITPIEGETPKFRVVILQWESLEKVQAWVNSPEYKDLRKIGDKYAQFRIFVVEGLPQSER